MLYEREEVRLNVVKNVLYHHARRRVYETWNRFFNFLVIVLGTAAASDFLDAYGITQVRVGLATAIVGALQLVIDFGGKARDHRELHQRYTRLLAEIEKRENVDLEQCAAWRSEVINISADEPPILHAIDAKAYNDALARVGSFDLSKERLVIPAYHQLLAGFLYFDGYTYKRASEVGKESARSAAS